MPGLAAPPPVGDTFRGAREFAGRVLGCRGSRRLRRLLEAMHQAYKNYTGTTMSATSSKIVHAPIYRGEARFEKFQNLFEISQY